MKMGVYVVLDGECDIDDYDGLNLLCAETFLNLGLLPLESLDLLILTSIVSDGGLIEAKTRPSKFDMVQEYSMKNLRVLW
jgi:hypothetical protein